jgi:hypothetical protein
VPFLIARAGRDSYDIVKCLDRATEEIDIPNAGKKTYTASYIFTAYTVYKT